MKKQKQGQIQPETTNDKDDKHPFRKKMQRAVSDETFKTKDLPKKLTQAKIESMILAWKIAQAQANRGRFL